MKGVVSAVVANATVFSTVRRVRVGVATYFLPIVGCCLPSFWVISSSSEPCAQCTTGLTQAARDSGGGNRSALLLGRNFSRPMRAQVIGSFTGFFANRSTGIIRGLGARFSPKLLASVRFFPSRRGE